MRILVCDDDQSICLGLKTLLGEHHDVVIFHDGAKALEYLSKQAPDLVISDNHMPGLTGMELLPKIKEQSPQTSVILMTAFGSVEQSVQAIKLGADDYLTKPFDFAEVEYRVQRLEDLKSWKAENTLKLEEGRGVNRLIGDSQSTKEMKRFITQVATVDSPVLLLGPTGSGKEMVARAIHESGPRANRPFIAINCASLQEQLMESELFGHEKGAFTGAVAAKPGKFELANGGTLFLDELGELSQGLQAKLLRVLQEKQFYRVGGTREITSGARVIAATHRGLKEMVATGAFREDLYFRFNVLSFELPPLSARREDIPILIDFFMKGLEKQLGKPARLTKETRELLLKYPYPGNVRELKNVLERLVVVCPPTGMVGPFALPSEFHLTHQPTAAGSAPAGTAVLGEQGLTETVEAFEASLIAASLEQSKQNQAQAARILKIDRSALRYKMKKYGLLGGEAASEQDDTSKAA